MTQPTYYATYAPLVCVYFYSGLVFVINSDIEVQP